MAEYRKLPPFPYCDFEDRRVFRLVLAKNGKFARFGHVVVISQLHGQLRFFQKQHVTGNEKLKNFSQHRKRSCLTNFWVLDTRPWSCVLYLARARARARARPALRNWGLRPLSTRGTGEFQERALGTFSCYHSMLANEKSRENNFWRCSKFFHDFIRFSFNSLL